MRLTKKYENGTFGVADKLPCGENSHDFKQLLINNLGWYEERDPARSAPETTASPSETAADKGILTEEELKERNRLLILEKENLRAALLDISTHVGDIRKPEFYYEAYLEVKKLAAKALEEIINE